MLSIIERTIITISSTRLIAPALGTGLLMAGYLLLRPYGDAQGALAHAFASPRWVAAHVCGVSRSPRSPA